MMTGAVLIVVGLPLGFYGATKFNTGTMLLGWAIAGVGVVVFLSHLINLP